MPAAKVRKYKIAFFSTPKAASTSVKLVLYKLKEGVEWKGDPDGVHPEFPTSFPFDSNDFFCLSDYYKFCVIRDPIKRLLSSFYNRIYDHKDLEKCLASKGLTENLFKEKYPNLNIFPNIENYLINLQAYQNFSHSIKHHTISAKFFIGNQLNLYDKIYKIESLKELAIDLGRLTGKKVLLHRKQVSKKSYIFSELPYHLKKILISYTQEEYELLSDYYIPPKI